jgi:hypothetical protein
MLFDFPIKQIIEVTSGSSCHLLLDLGFGISHDIHVKLSNIDTPDTKGISKNAGLIAKETLEKWLKSKKNLYLCSKKWDRHSGKVTGSIYVDGNRKNTASDFMLKKELAKIYDGDKKFPWSEEDFRKIEGMK